MFINLARSKFHRTHSFRMFHMHNKLPDESSRRCVQHEHTHTWHEMLTWDIGLPEQGRMLGRVFATQPSTKQQNPHTSWYYLTIHMQLHSLPSVQIPNTINMEYKGIFLLCLSTYHHHTGFSPDHHYLCYLLCQNLYSNHLSSLWPYIPPLRTSLVTTYQRFVGIMSIYTSLSTLPMLPWNQRTSSSNHYRHVEIMSTDTFVQCIEQPVYTLWTKRGETVEADDGTRLCWRVMQCTPTRRRERRR